MAKLKDNKSEKKQIWSQWLETLQQESWQLELLISGLALFGIYESKSFIDEVILGFSTHGHGDSGLFTAPLILLLKSGWLIFFLNLLVHVILRGLWIGAIGLRYVSRDIDYEALDYSDVFTKYLKDKVGDYDDFIERLEKICSVLFAYTFLLFLLLMSLLLFFFQVFLLGVIIPGDDQSLKGMVAILYFLLGFIVFVDFITLGGIKKIKEDNVSKVYMYIYKFFSITTLSFLYRPLIYNFIDDRYTKRLFFLSIPYIFLVLFYGNLFSNETYPYYDSGEADDYSLYINKMQYEDERTKWYSENNMKKELTKHGLPRLTISQFQVDKPYLEIFIRMLGNDQYLYQKDSLVPFQKPGFRFSLFSDDDEDDPTLEKMTKERVSLTRELRKERRALKKAVKKDPSNVTNINRVDALTTEIDSIINYWTEKQATYKENRISSVIDKVLSYNELTIDGVDIRPELDCYFFTHPNFNEKGILCMYPTDSLARGKHILVSDRTLYNYSDESEKQVNDPVPFYIVR